MSYLTKMTACYFVLNAKVVVTTLQELFFIVCKYKRDTFLSLAVIFLVQVLMIS